MANQEHLTILKQGVEAWNCWRKEHPQIWPDLSGTNLIRANLSGGNLSGADLRDANLSGASLIRTDLSGASLMRADLSETDLSEAEICGANLSGASLIGAKLSGAALSGTDFAQAKMWGTLFIAVDLSDVKGLDTAIHLAPSPIDIYTIYRSEGHIPEIFLRKAGVPDTMIEYMRSLVVHPIDYYTCFISYASKDQAFAERIYTDLQSKGVRCWFAPEDMKIGDKIRHRIDESIHLYDKLLLVLSEHSVNSQWVEQEVETALSKEREGQPHVLFPIRLDETVMQLAAGWPALIHNTRHIGDFTKWKQHDDYQQALERLLRDLKAEA